jgi:hypothetical protein
MSTRSTPWLRSLAIVAFAATTGVAAQAARYVTEVITTAPPAPQVETVTVAPHPDWVWQPGFWEWKNGRYVWKTGHWVEPRPGFHWEPHVWVKEGEGWRLREGEWVKVRAVP